jgi:hypothetical protein
MKILARLVVGIGYFVISLAGTCWLVALMWILASAIMDIPNETGWLYLVGFGVYIFGITPILYKAMQIAIGNLRRLRKSYAVV